MQKPNGYDEVQASGEFTKVELGGHYAVVKQVTERQSSTGKNMIVVLFDFADNDKQRGYFSTMFTNDDRPEKKWPFAGSKYIMVNDYNDPNKTSRNFKTFCSSVEKSNNYKVTWGGKDWGKQFVGKRIGVVFGEEEHEYDGKTSMRRLPKWFCKWDAVDGAGIPETKYLAGHAPVASTNQAVVDGFVNAGVGSDMEEIPF